MSSPLTHKHHCATFNRLKGVIWSKTSEPSLLYACDYSGEILSFNFNESAKEPLVQVYSHKATNDISLRTITLTNKSIVVGGDNLEVVDFDHEFSNCRVLYGHEDFVRRIVSHPKKPWLISSSDDTTTRVWNYETKSFVDQILDCHSHYVMDVAVRFDEKKDFTMIATASLDKSIKLFGIVGDGPHQLLGSMLHGEFGVNCVAFVSNDIAISGSDDKTIKIWNLKTFQCIAKDSVYQVVNACKAQKDLIFSCGDSGYLFVHRLVIENSQRVELESIYIIECVAIGRLWCLDTFWCNYSKQTTIAVGGDEGLYVIQLGPKHSFICTDLNNKLTDLTIICTIENDN